MDHGNRLPSIQDMMNGATAPQSAWTAINHRTEHPRPVSPHTHHANPQVNGHFSPQSHSERRIPHQAPPALTSIGPLHSRSLSAGHSPRFPPSGEHHAAGKPINAQRQDSAVFESTTSSAATIVPLRNTSSQSSTSSESRDCNVRRNPVAQPLTPPSDSTSAQAHPGHRSVMSLSNSSTYSSIDNQSSGSPATRVREEVSDSIVNGREREHADLAKPTTTASSRATAVVNGKNSMPPPPIPGSVFTLSPEPADMGSPSTSTSPSTLKHRSDATNADKESQEKCTFCHATWSFPPPDPPALPTNRTSRTYIEMHRNMEALTTYQGNYIARKEADYEKWQQLHSSGHCHSTESQTGSKRKPEEPLDDGSPPPKTRKLSADSSPQDSQLTPPPELAVDGTGSATHLFQPRNGLRNPVTSKAVAQILRAAPVPKYEAPAPDANNMFYDAHTEGTAH